MNGAAMATPVAKPVLGTPGGPSSGLKAATPASINRFLTRTNALERVESLNEHLAQATSSDHSPAASTSRVSLATTADPRSYDYRYMYERLMDRSEKIDNQLDDAAELFRRHYLTAETGEVVEEFTDPSLTSDVETLAIGRIQADWETQGAVKLGPDNIVLETSRLLGAGSRVTLKLAPNVRVRGAAPGETQNGLFPGAIVAVRGRNGGAGFFSVSEIITVRYVFDDKVAAALARVSRLSWTLQK